MRIWAVIGKDFGKNLKRGPHESVFGNSQNVQDLRHDVENVPSQVAESGVRWQGGSCTRPPPAHCTKYLVPVHPWMCHNRAQCLQWCGGTLALPSMRSVVPVLPVATRYTTLPHCPLPLPSPAPHHVPAPDVWRWPRNRSYRVKLQFLLPEKNPFPRLSAHLRRALMGADRPRQT